MASTPQFTPDQADFLINHCFLPPKLPEKDDEERDAPLLFTLFSEVAGIYNRYLEHEEKRHWAPIWKSIMGWQKLWNNSNMCESTVVDLIRKMPDRFVLLVPIQAQNAALLLTKLENATRFEAWEVAARQEDVLAAKDALRRQYPARAVELSAKTMSDPAFVQELGTHIYRLSMEAYVPDSMEKTQKARRQIEESRQSKHPRLVTEWLLNILATIGHRSQSIAVVKRTHDDLNFRHALNPFRRSSILSCIKIALQLAIFHTQLGEASHKHYKQFMLCFLSQLGIQLLPSQPPLEYLFVIRAKLARRAAKLQSDMPKFVQKMFLSAMNQITAEMTQRWEEVIQWEVQEVAPLLTATFDHNVHLRDSGRLLELICQKFEDDEQLMAMIEVPDPSIAFSLDENELPGTDVFDVQSPQLIERVVVFQTWVAEHLPTWLQRASPTNETCDVLKLLLDRYWNAARSCFSAFAEQMSEVFLTTLELWVALDKMTMYLHKMLEEYSPELPANVFGPLLLPKRPQMARLLHAESYIASRHAKANSNLPSVFDTATPQSFSVRTFEKSQHLQQLMAEIKEAAACEKEEVRARFYELKAEFEGLMATSKAMECDKWWFYEGPKAGTYEHRFNCEKCFLFKQASRMSIGKFEEYLPAYDAAQKAVVFELQPGVAFAAWRDATWLILHDVLSPTVTTGVAAEYKLSDYGPLSRYFCTPRRISFASVKKPHAETHRFTCLITVAEDAVILPHAMSSDLYDTNRIGVWPKDQTSMFSVARFCHAQLGKSSYSALIETVRTTLTSQNNIMARQSSCPLDISVHDWIVFGSLRAGARLQLMNFLRTLLADELDLLTPSTIIVVEQMLHEAGAAAGAYILRSTHVEFLNSSFVRQLLDSATDMLHRIAANWKETNAATLLKVVLQRVLTVTTDTAVVAGCLSLIRRLRQISVDWLARLASRYEAQRRTGTSVASSAEIRRRIFEVAMLGRAT